MDGTAACGECSVEGIHSRSPHCQRCAPAPAKDVVVVASMAVDSVVVVVVDICVVGFYWG